MEFEHKVSLSYAAYQPTVLLANKLHSSSASSLLKIIIFVLKLCVGMALIITDRVFSWDSLWYGKLVPNYGYK